jgi:hypothetical protein
MLMNNVRNQRVPYGFPVTTFDCAKADESMGFHKWMKSHPAELYLSFSSASEVVLHHAHCPTHEANGAASRQRICAPTSKELRQWAARNGALLSTCHTCKAD